MSKRITLVLDDDLQSALEELQKKLAAATGINTISGVIRWAILSHTTPRRHV